MYQWHIVVDVDVDAPFKIGDMLSVLIPPKSRPKELGQSEWTGDIMSLEKKIQESEEELDELEDLEDREKLETEIFGEDDGNNE